MYLELNHLNHITEKSWIGDRNSMRSKGTNHDSTNKECSLDSLTRIPSELDSRLMTYCHSTYIDIGRENVKSIEPRLVTFLNQEYSKEDYLKEGSYLLTKTILLTH